jgi:predicted ArsR family transcriptional regulator
VKFVRPATAGPEAGVVHAGAEASAVATNEGRTRDAVARLVLESGPLTAAALADRLHVSAAAVRRHLDALVTDGIFIEVEPRVAALPRGRGRPARAYALTDRGRSSFGHAYDDLASTALRYLRQTGGESAVQAFADHRAHTLAGRITDRLSGEPASDAGQRVTSVAAALSDEGYAASVEPAGQGVQLCQHHCPVAHVAAEFPELCEAETRALAEVLGTYVQRLATIAHGDGVCTTHVPNAASTTSARPTSTTSTASTRQERTTTPKPQLSRSGRR